MSDIDLKKFRWSRVYESSEIELQHYLESKGFEAERWEATEFHDFGGQIFTTDTIIFCAEGGLVFEIDKKKISLQPGDALRIPANHAFAAKAGMTGCVCYEVAHA